MTRPRLKYIRSGTSVRPFSVVLPIELADLVLVQQQLAPAPGVVVDVAAMAVRVDVDVVQPHLALLDAGVAVAQVGLALADALHLGAEQRDAGLEGLEHVVVVQRLAVVGDELVRRPAVASRARWRGGGVRALTGPPPAGAARSAASRTACTRLPGSATPRPAMSNAVP